MSKKEAIVEALSPDADGMEIINTLQALGTLDAMTAKEVGVLISGKPPRTDVAAYMRWRRVAVKAGLDTSRKVLGLSRDEYNAMYYAKTKGRKRGAGAWELVAKELSVIIPRLQEIERIALERSARLQSRRKRSRAKPDSGSGRRQP